jgi:hypothetical protein
VVLVSAVSRRMKDERLENMGGDQMIEFRRERMEQSEYDREDLQVSETREGGKIWRRRGKNREARGRLRVVRMSGQREPKL